MIESPIFTRLWPDYWTEDERAAFTAYMAAHPDAGDVIRGSGGCRKVRWARGGRGKSGGVRVIYVVGMVSGELVLLTIYSKSSRDTLPADVLRKLVTELGHATE